MSSKAYEKQLRGQDTSEKQVAEGLCGVNVPGFSDPRTTTGLPNVVEGKKSDPECVQRKNPENVAKYMQGAGEGIGYDTGSATVATLEGSTPQSTSSGASASQTGILPRTYEFGGHGDPRAFGSTGDAETFAGVKEIELQLGMILR